MDAGLKELLNYGVLGVVLFLVLGGVSWGVREAWFAIYGVLFSPPSVDAEGKRNPGGWLIRFFSRSIETAEANERHIATLTETMASIKQDTAELRDRRCMYGVTLPPPHGDSTGGSGIHGGK